MGLRRCVAVFAGVCGLVFGLGCASPGPPLPPSLRLPEKVTKLEAVRVDGEVRLGFTVPLDTTDGQQNRAGMQAAVCRAVAAKACVEVGRVGVVPGEVRYVDALPQDLRTASPQLLSYTVKLFNARGRTAGDGVVVYAAAGATPPPVSGLQATPRRGAVLLRWQPESAPAEMEVTRRATDAPVPQKPGKKQTKGFSGLGGKKNDGGVVRLSAGAGVDKGGTVDSGVHDGAAYAYTAQRVQRVVLAGHALELRGAESGAVAIAYHDVFPPAAPLGLVAVAGAGKSPGIDLVWEPSAEDDVTGYNVYRREGGGFQKLAATTVGAYRDLAVTPGVAYTYRVTAVDARGNESPPSVAITEKVQP